MSSPDANTASPDPGSSSSLVLAIQRGAPEGWSRLVDLFAPVVARWCRNANVREQDVDDVLQEVFRAVARKVVDFRRDPKQGSFHGWLYTITQNKIADHYRRLQRQPPAPGGSDFQDRLLEEPAEGESSISSLPKSDSDALVRRCLDLIEPEFKPATWKAFWQATIDDRDTADIARELAMTSNAVRLAKSRVLARLRQVLEELSA